MLSDKEGLTYEENLKKVILDRLKLENTIVNLTENHKDSYNRGFYKYNRVGSLSFGLIASPLNLENGMAGAGGIRSSGEDMLSFLKAVIGNKDDFIALSKEAFFEIDEHESMGLGWIIDKNFIEDYTIIWHNGQTMGFSCFIGIVEDKNAGFFLLTNTSDIDFNSIAKEILSIMSND
ncbi:serine hydrolase [Clostridium sp. D2Q-11]|uniref:Serine hydrolase n=1 Tax=Anaeromonas frigoriresistens TaxID=2683708 RepID=A0A942Z9T1_9FIRM|nr:serine hydrolase [Anaeromonas frigoriresistens]